MTREELKRRFPNASADFIASNSDKNCSALPHAKQPERTASLDSSHAGEAQSAGGVPVCFTLYRVVLLDVDAKYASVKDLLDCLVNAGIVAGDKEGQVDLKVIQVKVKTEAEERTEIEIEIP